MLLVAAVLDAAAATPPAASVDVVGILREFGFPIFVAMWFMWRLEKKLDKFTEQIEKLYRIAVITAKTLDAKAMDAEDDKK